MEPCQVVFISAALIFVIMCEYRDRKIRKDMPNCRDISVCSRNGDIKIIEKEYTQTPTEILKLILHYNNLSNYNVYWRVAVIGATLLSLCTITDPLGMWIITGCVIHLTYVYFDYHFLGETRHQVNSLTNALLHQQSLSS